MVDVDSVLEREKARYFEEMSTKQAELEEHLTALGEEVASLGQFTKLEQVTTVAPIVHRLKRALDEADAKAKLFNARESECSTCFVIY
jgi:hypothetical protein